MTDLVPDRGTKPRLLLVDDSEAFLRSLSRALSRDYEVMTAARSSDAKRLLERKPDGILLDLRLDETDSSNSSGFELLQIARDTSPSVPVIIITGHGDVESAVTCMQAGAEDFIQKGGDVRELKLRVDKALEQARLRQRLRNLEEEMAIVEPRRLIGESACMREVKGLIAAVSRDSRVTVLISGETGTGKELVARAIHASGPRASRPFIPVSIPALPATTLESELFGYEPGAFTDAKQRHLGLVERAHGGVLFLDEVGDLPIQTQVKLLRFLEERTLARLGGTREIATDVQLVAATNTDLTSAIATGSFREDLYYRLKVCEIKLPPLRSRKEDLPSLMEFFEDRLGAKSKGISTFSPRAVAAIESYDWPGNIRELRNTVESSLLKASLRRSTVIEPCDLPEEVREQGSPGGSTMRTIEGSEPEGPIPISEAVAVAELEQVQRALQISGGKKTEAWKLLGLNDRFVFSNRVRRLCRRFPELVRRYPAVSSAFLRNDRKN